MKRYPKKSVLFREGDSGSEMFIIGAGRVEVQKRIGGLDKTVAVLGPGDMLGELALLNDKPRTATAIVLDDLDALVIDKPTLESMIDSSPDFTMRLIRRLSDRLDAADGLIQLLMHPDADARDTVLRQAESAKGASAIDEPAALEAAMDIQGEVGGDPTRVRDLFGRLNRLRARLREQTPTANEMPRPFTMGGAKGTKKP